jgi:hypothetical protein
MLKRLFMSSNRRFIVDEDGSPFFWLGDTAWELFHRLNREEAKLYLENRRQKGFNVIQAVVLAEIDGLHDPNPYGHIPLMDDDPTKPDERYFQHVDYVINVANEKGLYVGLLPTWGDKVNRGLWGTGPVVFTPENAYTYGHYLGQRYRNHKNILWILGGDRPASNGDNDYAPVWNAMARGIQAAMPLKAFMTYHPRGGHSSSAYFHYSEWLDMNMWQSGHVDEDAPNWDMITEDYHRIPPKPVLDGEPCYEDHPINPFTRKWQPEYGYFDDYHVRKQAYRAVFAGACGHTYGHHTIWQMYDTHREPLNFPVGTWKEALDRPGASQVIHLKNLMLSRPYLTRIPEQSLVLSETGAGATHLRATRSSDGSYAMIYIPCSETVEVDTTRLAGEQITGWWYDPRTGEAQQIGQFQRGSSSFTPPGELDYVLVLDDTGQNFPPPGSK